MKRIKIISSILDTYENVSTKFLANKLKISESTVRRDINYMVSSGKYETVNKVYGGLTLTKTPLDRELIFEIKKNMNKRLKVNIAKKAIQYIDRFDKIIIDSGTTCLYFSEQLKTKKDISVITLDIKIAEELGKNSNIEASIIGGLVRPGYFSIGGSIALENLRSFYVKKVFMSVDAFDLEFGITNASEFEVGVKRKLLEMGAHVYILADYLKIKTQTLYKVAQIPNVTTLITNKELDTEIADKIKEAGIDLVLA